MTVLYNTDKHQDFPTEFQLLQGSKDKDDVHWNSGLLVLLTWRNADIHPWPIGLQRYRNGYQ